MQNGEDSDEDAADPQKTPAAGDRMDIDEPGSTGGRMTRGMLLHECKMSTLVVMTNIS